MKFHVDWHDESLWEYWSDRLCWVYSDPDNDLHGYIFNGDLFMLSSDANFSEDNFVIVFNAAVSHGYFYSSRE